MIQQKQFHYVVENGICFLCMSDIQNKHRIPFAFLSEIQNLFTTQYGFELPQRAIAFSLNEEFSPKIRERMEYYNNAGSNVDNISAVKNQIEDVKGVMVENIEKVLERGEKIELLVDKTDRLNQAAFKFESSSRNLRRAMWWKNVRWVGFLVVVGGFALFFVASLFCGMDFHRCKKHWYGLILLSGRIMIVYIIFLTLQSSPPKTYSLWRSAVLM